MPKDAMATTVSTAVLKAVPLFASCPDDQLRMLTPVVTRKSAPRATTVLAAGDLTDSLTGRWCVSAAATR
jgi:hypothetical protein